MPSQRIRLVDGQLDDVPAVCALGSALIQGHPPVKVLQRRMQRQDSVLHLAVRDTTLAGFLTTYWLTAEADQAVARGEVTRGGDLVLEWLAEHTADVTTCYLAMIASVGAAGGPDVDHRVTAALLKRLANVASRYPNLEAVLARPATPRGRSLLVRLGLEPVQGQPRDGLWHASWASCATGITEVRAALGGDGLTR